MNPLLSERPMSGFPVSIGTSLALETIFTPVAPVFDVARIVPEFKERPEYTMTAINVSTLLRNLIASISSKEVMTIHKKEFLAALLEEIEFLTSFFESNQMPVKFYIHTYTYVKQTYGGKDKDKLRKATTDRQLWIEDVTNYCLDHIRKQDDVDVFHKDVKYGKEDTALIMTHVPFDLLSFGNFVRLDLLESHTGLVKTRKDWWSKYHPLPDRDMSFLPLFEYLLVVFGDSVQFHPDPLKHRVEVYDAMKKKGVHPLMSEFSLLLNSGQR